MKIIKNCLILLFLISFMSLNAFAAPKFFDSGNKKDVPPNPIFNNTVTVPAGYLLPVTTKDTVDVNNMAVADRFYTVLKNDFFYNNQLIAPEGSNIIGTIVKITQPTATKKAEFFVKFTGIVTPEGQNIPISAIFKTDDNSGILYSNNYDFGINQNSTRNIIIMQPITFIHR